MMDLENKLKKKEQCKRSSKLQIHKLKQTNLIIVPSIKINLWEKKYMKLKYMLYKS